MLITRPTAAAAASLLLHGQRTQHKAAPEPEQAEPPSETQAIVVCALGGSWQLGKGKGKGSWHCLGGDLTTASGWSLAPAAPVQLIKAVIGSHIAASVTGWSQPSGTGWF